MRSFDNPDDEAIVNDLELILSEVDAEFDNEISGRLKPVSSCIDAPHINSKDAESERGLDICRRKFNGAGGILSSGHSAAVCSKLLTYAPNGHSKGPREREPLKESEKSAVEIIMPVHEVPKERKEHKQKQKSWLKRKITYLSLGGLLALNALGWGLAYCYAKKADYFEKMVEGSNKAIFLLHKEATFQRREIERWQSPWDFYFKKRPLKDGERESIIWAITDLTKRRNKMMDYGRRIEEEAVLSDSPEDKRKLMNEAYRSYWNAAHRHPFLSGDFHHPLHEDGARYKK